MSWLDRHIETQEAIADTRRQIEDLRRETERLIETRWGVDAKHGELAERIEAVEDPAPVVVVALPRAIVRRRRRWWQRIFG